ncbi:MAG: hypothetical protein WDN47_04265 [Candidatus Doudnabacteria bacterium]
MSEGTAPAWQVRDMQRQKLLEKLFDNILEANQPDAWIMGLASFLVALLSAKEASAQPGFTARLDEDMLHFFDAYISTAIEPFARSQEEKDVLYLRLAEKLLESGGSKITAELSKQEMMNPKLIFGVEDRTEEIPIPDE